MFLKTIHSLVNDVYNELLTNLDSQVEMIFNSKSRVSRLNWTGFNRFLKSITEFGPRMRGHVQRSRKFEKYNRIWPTYADSGWSL